MAKRKSNLRLGDLSIDAQWALRTGFVRDAIYQYVSEGYGRRCPDYDAKCFVCKAWRAADAFSKIALD